MSALTRLWTLFCFPSTIGGSFTKNLALGRLRSRRRKAGSYPPAAHQPSSPSSSSPTMPTNNDREDRHDESNNKGRTSRPRNNSLSHGDGEQSQAKRPRFSVDANLRQSTLPFQPIAKSKSEGHNPSSSGKGPAKDESVKETTTSKFFPAKGHILDDDRSYNTGKSSSASEQAAKHSKRDSSPPWGHSSTPWVVKARTDDRESRRKGGSFASQKECLKAIAASTLEAIDDGSYKCDGRTYDLKSTVEWMNDHTVYYPPNSELENWKAAANPALRKGEKNTEITLMQFTTLEGSRWMHAIASSASGTKNPRIGVLNFASAKKPGGGFINGARAQEESIARSSTLYASLMIPESQSFYTLHRADAKGGFYTHAMIYSPRVQLIKDDAGEWLQPVEVEMITSPAVNAGDVRNKYYRRQRKEESEEGVWKQDRRGSWTRRKGAKPGSDKEDEDESSDADFPDAQSEEELEEFINDHMYERMARILYLCQLQGIPNLVLGSFGTGVFCNCVETVAELWMMLLADEEAPFRGVFERVLFAIMDTETIYKFANVFGNYGIEVTSAREDVRPEEHSGRKWKGKGRSLEESSSTDVSMQDLSQEWKMV